MFAYIKAYFRDKKHRVVLYVLVAVFALYGLYRGLGY